MAAFVSGWCQSVKPAQTLKPQSLSSRPLHQTQASRTRSRLRMSSALTDTELKTISSLTSRESYLDTFESLKSQGKLRRWSSYPIMVRNVTESELKLITKMDFKTLIGQNQAASATDLRNAFLIVLFTSSFLAVLAAAILPPDLGYFASYLIGGISIVFVGIGSSNPSLLSAILSKVSSRARKGYKERVIRHEAAHLLVAYLLGLPIAEMQLVSKGASMNAVSLYDVDGSRAEIDKVSVVSLAGAVGEFLEFGFAEGINADLDQLQKIFIRANPPLKQKEIESQTRWAAMQAFTILRTYKAVFDQLVATLEEGGDVAKCIKVMEETIQPNEPKINSN